MSCVADRDKPIVIKPKTAKVATDIKTLNQSLSEIPDGELSYDDAIVRWSEDRSAYGECRIKHKALADSIDILEND